MEGLDRIAVGIDKSGRYMARIEVDAQGTAGEVGSLAFEHMIDGHHDLPGQRIAQKTYGHRPTGLKHLFDNPMSVIKRQIFKIDTADDGAAALEGTVLQTCQRTGKAQFQVERSAVVLS